MVKKIVLFNHKGGVSKTTTTLHLGWMLAEKGHNVILADFDPQCNLTGLILNYRSAEDLEALYMEKPEANVKAGLAPAFEAKPELIKPIECIEVKNRKGLFLIPGHIGLSDYETTLGVAQDVGGSIQALQNLPGSLSYLLNTTAEKYDADYILIDTSPSLGPINRNLVMTSDFFLIPTSPDFFDVMALDSLSEILPKWKRWALQMHQLQIFREASYPFPATHVKFLGIIIQRFTKYGGGDTPSSSFQKWFDQIETKVNSKLEIVLQKNDMLLPDVEYSKVEFASKKYTLSTIADFNSLIADSQQTNTPVFAMSNPKQREFHAIFNDLANKILVLTENA